MDPTIDHLSPCTLHSLLIDVNFISILAAGLILDILTSTHEQILPETHIREMFGGYMLAIRRDLDFQLRALPVLSIIKLDHESVLHKSQGL